MTTLRSLARVGRAIPALARLEFSPVLPPWSKLRTDPSTIGQLRRRATALSPHQGPAVTVVRWLVAVWWPFAAVCDAVTGMIRHGSPTQLWHSLILAFRWNISPRNYYLYQLWQADHRGYLQTDEMNVLEELINRDTDTRTISDKVLFDRSCRAAGLPVPDLVALIDKDWVGSGLPASSVFVKRVWGMQGKGAQRWTYDDGRWSHDAYTLTAKQLTSRLRRDGRWHQLMIQACLTNHPEVARYTLGALSTFRVMTYRDQRTHVLGVVFKMAAAGSDVDNLHAGGLVAAVDPDTGEMHQAITRNPSGPVYDVHPETGERIAGAHLTVHRGVIDLALRAHETLDVPWSVGWDVAATPDGPVLIEGNSGWGIDLFHVPYRQPLPVAFAQRVLDLV